MPGCDTRSFHRGKSGYFQKNFIPLAFPILGLLRHQAMNSACKAGITCEEGTMEQGDSVL